MSDRGAQPTCVGFLTAVTHRQLGVFGGYLLLHLNGRPLEFHCTTPVKANRAQEILYANTLTDYLYGEVIGQTLVSKAQTKPKAVFTDRRAMLALREMVPYPVFRVLRDEAADRNGADAADMDEPAEPAPASVAMGVNRVCTAAGFETDAQSLPEELQPWVKKFDLSEPFARIREAIKEAQAGKAA